jgi:hypothetical protein
MDDGNADLAELHARAGKAHREAADQHMRDGQDQEDDDLAHNQDEDDIEEICDPTLEYYDPDLCEEMSMNRSYNFNANTEVFASAIPLGGGASIVDGALTFNARPTHNAAGPGASIVGGSLVFHQRGSHAADNSVTNNSAADGIPTLNWAEVSWENRATYFDRQARRRRLSRNRKAVGSYADVLDDAEMDDREDQKRRDEGSFTTPGRIPEGRASEIGAIPSMGPEPGQHGGYDGYWNPTRTISSEQAAREAFEQDELDRERRRRLGLVDENEDYEYHDTRMNDILGGTHPPLGKSQQEFLDETCSEPGSGARGYGQTTRWGSGPRDWETRNPAPAYSGNQLFAGMPNNDFTRNMRNASGGGAGGMVSNDDGSEGTFGGIPRLDYAAISRENRQRNR